MKPLLTLIAASTLALAATSAQALTIENKSSTPAAVTVINAGKQQSLRVKAKGQETASCTANCQVKYNGKSINAMKDDHVIISPTGALQKAGMKKDMKK